MQKIFKKFLSLMIMTAVFTGFTACNHNSDEPSSPTGGAGGGNNGPLIKVGIINRKATESGYRAANVKDFETVFTSAKGYDSSFFYSNVSDDQIEAAEGFIASGVEYLLICPANRNAWLEVLQSAKEKGIKVFFYDYAVDYDDDLYECAVVSDMEEEGKTAVAWLKSLNLNEYNVIHLQGAIGSDAQVGRTAALEEEFKADRMTKVFQDTANWQETDAKSMVESVIKSGDSFNVIYAENDGMANGAVKALDEAHITHGVNGDVVILSFDCDKWALRKLLAGEWNCNVQCSPFHAELIDGFIKTGTVPAKQVSPVERAFDARTITQADVDKFGLGD